MPDQMGSKSGPKMRPKSSTPSRPRPKTIHVESGPSESYTSRTVSTMASKGKRGSGNNLAGLLFGNSSPPPFICILILILK